VGCGKPVTVYGRGSWLNAGNRVGDDVVLAGYAVNVRRDLWDVVHMFELPWRTLVTLLLEG